MLNNAIFGLVFGALAILALIAGAFYLFTAAHWIGHFTLAVHLQAEPNIDLDSIEYMEVRSGEAVQQLVERDDPGTYFMPPHRRSGSVHQVQITCTGVTGPLVDKYHQPEWVLIQYRLKDDGGAARFRKAARLPVGRGDRSLTVTLP